MSFGGFGTTTSQPAFGANQTQTTTGLGLFGQNTQQQQPVAATGGLFGTQQPQTQPTTGLFGQPTSQGLGAGGSSLGTTQSATGLFGQPQPTSGGLFGQNQPTAQVQSTASGLFGNQPQNTSGSGGLFGNTAATTGATGGGLFGNSGTTTTAGGLFGNQQQQQQQQQQPQQQPTGGLFGNASATTQPVATASGFGGSLFGPRPTTTGFTNAPLTISTLGGPSTSTLPQPAQTTASSPNPIFGKVEEIYSAWNPASPSCRFQYYFYNMVDPQQVALYGRPPNATNEALWQKAVRENPDPTCLVPVLALGFEDVKKRVDAQAANAAAQQQQLTELASRLEAIAQKHTLTTSVRAQKAAQAQTQIKQRITALVQHLHFMIPTVRSSSIRPEEEALRAALESIDEELKRPGGLGRMKGKLSELWTAVGALGAMRERARKAGEEFGGWQVRDEASLNELAQILHNEQQGLLHLTKILKDDMTDVEIIEVGLSGRESRSKLGQSRNNPDVALVRSLLR
ncbi:hypothetical protein M407DRAFT_158060 [Tulasnella calospora MUT 4182]|uniref:Nucleoporin Nup54 alpha-helical domain-containing protein n=1 Tax=Tulasnella calospora MUT 4182 TaxID=1051891 RepID=A0A0C3QPB5_9AGAM|nr:hypothetical protein M407DRAFT_158060 [Tulasnella calospora MUT 4182]